MAIADWTVVLANSNVANKWSDAGGNPSGCAVIWYIPSVTAASTSYISRDIYIPTGYTKIELSFDALNGGRGTYAKAGYGIGGTLIASITPLNTWATFGVFDITDKITAGATNELDMFFVSGVADQGTPANAPLIPTAVGVAFDNIKLIGVI